MAYEWEGKKIPEVDFVKAQHNMALCDADMAYISVYIQGTNHEYREIERNEAAIREIIAAEVDFYENNLLKRNPPMFRGDPLESKAIQSLQHEDQIIHEVIELDDEVDKMVSESEEHKIKESDAKRNKERRNNELKIRMGRNEIAYTKNFKITYKFRDKNKFDRKKLFKDHPELEEKYTHIERERCLYINPSFE